MRSSSPNLSNLVSLAKLQVFPYQALPMLLSLHYLWWHNPDFCCWDALEFLVICHSHGTWLFLYRNCRKGSRALSVLKWFYQHAQWRMDGFQPKLLVCTYTQGACIVSNCKYVCTQVGFVGLDVKSGLGQWYRQALSASVLVPKVFR